MQLWRTRRSCEALSGPHSIAHGSKPGQAPPLRCLCVSAWQPPHRARPAPARRRAPPRPPAAPPGAPCARLGSSHAPSAQRPAQHPAGSVRAALWRPRLLRPSFHCIRFPQTRSARTLCAKHGALSQLAGKDGQEISLASLRQACLLMRCCGFCLRRAGSLHGGALTRAHCCRVLRRSLKLKLEEARAQL